MHLEAMRPPSAARARPELLALRGVSHRYPDGREALRGITFGVFEGDRLAVLGHNGAGKTTLLNVLAGILPPSAGEVRLRGTILPGPCPEVGVLFQDPDDQLFCEHLLADAAFGPRNLGLSDPEGRARAALDLVGLPHLAYKPPHSLSHGQKKRAALAAVLAADPAILILDEPTTGLDPREERRFVEILSAFRGTLILVSHDLPLVAMLSDRAVVLDSGRIHHDCSVRDLLADPPHLRSHGLEATFRWQCCADDDNGLHRHAHDHGAGPHEHPVLVAAPIPENTPLLVRLRGFSHRYPDGTASLRGLDLDIHEGESVAILGENGAGKTTLARALLGVAEGTGTYEFEGKPVAPGARRALFRETAMVFQDPADQLLFPSVREEAAFGPERQGLPPGEVAARVGEALALVGLSGFEDRIPHHMSAGERKRLAIAAALAARPRLLILDEPTSALDPESEDRIVGILRALPTTRLVITHSLPLAAALAARTVVLHQGRIIRDYPTTAFLADHHLSSENGLDYTYRNACGQLAPGT